MSADADQRERALAPVRPVVGSPGAPVRGAEIPLRPGEPTWLARGVLGHRARPDHSGRVGAGALSIVLSGAPQLRQAPCKEA
jgi:hypothetical protein